MATTKHEIFRVPIKDEKNFILEKVALEKISIFLEDPNIVYVNHSISIASLSEREFNTNKLTNIFLIVSLVYKDLKETPLNLSKTSKKTINTIKKSIEQNDKIDPPIFKTKLESSLNNDKLQEKPD